MVLDILMFANILVPILCVIGFCHSNKGFLIDHVFIISAGYLFYWMMPIVTYQYGFLGNIFSEAKISSNLGVENDIIGYNIKIKYLIIAFGIYASFIIGHMLSIKIRINYYNIYPFSLKPLKYISYIFLVLLILHTIVSYESILKGYTMPIFALKGNIIALNLFILTLLIMYFTISNKSYKYTNIFKFNIFYIYLVSSILLASLGNRTWIICGILSFFIIYTNYYKRLSIKYLLLLFISLIVILAIFARFRTGNFTEINFNRIIYLAFFDTYAIHNGIKSYLVNNEIQYFNIPLVLLSKLLNIIPSLIFPNKGEFYITYSDIGANFKSIQAAWHSFGSMMIHFGSLGSMLLSFSLPFLLNYLRNSIYMKASYVVITAHFAAPFFRDFDNYAIKIILQICIIMPLLYLIICNIYLKIKYYLFR